MTRDEMSRITLQFPHEGCDLLEEAIESIRSPSGGIRDHVLVVKISRFLEEQTALRRVQ